MLWNEWRSFTSSIKLWHFQNLNGLEDLDRKCFFKQMGTILLSWQPLIGQIYQPISLNSLSSCHVCILLNLFRILHKKKKKIYIYIYIYLFQILKSGNDFTLSGLGLHEILMGIMIDVGSTMDPMTIFFFFFWWRKDPMTFFLSFFFFFGVKNIQWLN